MQEKKNLKNDFHWSMWAKESYSEGEPINSQFFIDNLTMKKLFKLGTSVAMWLITPKGSPFSNNRCKDSCDEDMMGKWGLKLRVKTG